MESTSTYNGWPHRRNPKRTHEQMESGRRDNADATRRQSPPWAIRDSPMSSSSTTPQTHRSHPQTSSLRLPPLLGRFAGDGLDFRRPIMSTGSTIPSRMDVIDLTSEEDPSLSDSSTRAVVGDSRPVLRSTRASRPPRFAREIIDLSEDPPEDPPEDAGLPPDAQPIRIPSSPEIQFVSSRRIPGRSSQAQAAVDVDLTNDNLVEGTWREGVNRGRPGSGGYGTRTQRDPFHRAARLDRRIRELFGTRTRGTRTGGLLIAGDRRMDRPHPYLNRMTQRLGIDIEEIVQPVLDHFIGPGVMDYGFAAFNLGPRDETPPPPTYTAPEPTKPGFTRSVQEDDVLVCPNCDADLCTGPEDSDKRQVWIIKACGHAYCGECAHNRHSSKRKGKEPAGSGSGRLPPPFQKCVIKDCEKKCTSRTAMIQLFL